MKTYIIFSIVVVYSVACSHGLALKEVGNPLTKIVEVKTELATDAKGVVSELKESAKHKKQALVDGVKAVAKAKLSIADGINKKVKEVKAALLKGVEAAKHVELSAIKDASQSFISKAIAAKKAHLEKIVAAVSPIKETATTLLNGAVNMVQDTIAKKKELLSHFTTPTEKRTVLLLPVSQEPITLHTYVSNEPPVIGKVFVQEMPVRISQPQRVQVTYDPVNVNSYDPQLVTYEDPSSNSQGSAVDTYGPPFNNYGPPANTYGTAVSA